MPPVVTGSGSSYGQKGNVCQDKLDRLSLTVAVQRLFAAGPARMSCEDVPLGKIADAVRRLMCDALTKPSSNNVAGGWLARLARASHIHSQVEAGDRAVFASFSSRPDRQASLSIEVERASDAVLLLEGCTR